MADQPLASANTLAVMTLWRREMVRFFRQRNRVIGAMATPLIFWLMLGFGLDRSFMVQSPQAGSSTVGYLEYFYPGTVVLVLLFTAIFSTISVIEDRREGFLQAVLVAPIHRMAIVLGKVLGGASIATLQGVIFLGLWPVIGGWPGIGTMLAATGVMFLLAVCLTALSLCLAWPMDSTAGFHAIMNLLLMPMWFLSGAVFPVDTAPTWMQLVMWANPLTYGQAAFSSLMRGDATGMSAPLGVGLAIGMVVVFSVVAVLAACRVVGRPRRGGA